MFPIENKKDTGRYIVIVVILLAIFAVFGIQLINWQIVNGSDYRAKADSTNQYAMEISPLRGEILDTNGVDLAVNITGYQVVFDSLYMTGENASETNQIKNDTILKLTDLFDRRGEEWINILPITLDADGNYAFTTGEDSEKDIAALKSHYRMQSYATAQECMDVITGDNHYKCADLSPKDKLTVASVRYNMEKNGFNAKTKYVFAENVSQDMVSIVEENHQKLPGVFSETVSVRKYVNGEVAPHIVGYMGAISQDEYDKVKDTGKYTINSQIGKNGIESSFEEQLIGTAGQKIVETTPSGAILNVKEVKNAQPGNTVYLTIDARMQKVASDALKKAVENAQATTRSTDPAIKYSGAVVALNLKDFSILCAQSYPSYDLTRFMEDSQYREDTLLDTDKKPMLSRVFTGTYPIGSSMKPAMAAAGLQEGTITRDSTVFCKQVYEWGTSYAKCMSYHGNTSLFKAMSMSCNYYFFDLGRRMGIDTMNLYSKRFGLAQKTGVEIPEAQGILAGREYTEGLGQIWYEGNTLNAVIGQGDNAFTPLQMATYVATIANNGVRLRTHIVDKITDYSRNQVVLDNNPDQPEVMANVEISQENLDLIKQSMYQVVHDPSGTAYHYFQGFPMEIAAKTGTAQLGLKDANGQDVPDHTTFIAFGPYEDPEIAVAVIIEHGQKTQWPADVAKAIFQAYMDRDNLPDMPQTNPDGTTTPVDDASSDSSSQEGSSSNAG